MSGIDRIIILDARHLAKHLPGTAATNRLLRRGRAAHVFHNEATLLRVAEAIIEQGSYRTHLTSFLTKSMAFRQPLINQFNA
jgi:hypothetical protein